MNIRCIDALGERIVYVTDLHNYFTVDESAFAKLSSRSELSEEELLDLVASQQPGLLDKFRHILVSRRGAAVPVEDLAAHDEYTLCLHPSRKCNLGCKYCFGCDDYLPTDEITFEKAKELIDFMVFDYAKKCNKLIVDLSGSGEPMLKFELIRQLHDYCCELRAKTQINIIISFATNATLITDEMVHFLKHENKCILYGVSIDGNALQNSNRVFKDGRPTYPVVVENIKKLNNGLLGLAVTVTPQNSDVDAVYDSLKQLGSDAISMHFVRCYDDSPVSLNSMDTDFLFAHYEKLMENLLDHIKRGDIAYVMPLLKGDDIFGGYINRAFCKGKLLQQRCDAGRNRLAVDGHGGIYCCSVLNGSDVFYLGNFYEGGINKKRQEELTRPNLEVSKTCSQCWCKNICSGECKANAYYTGIDLYEPVDSFCVIRKQLSAYAVAFAQKLADEYPEAYKQLMKFFIGTQRYTRKDSAVWSIQNVLCRSGRDVSFAEILDQANELNKNNRFDSSRGTHPRIAELILQQYDPGYCAVGLEDASALQTSVTFPCIAFMNKQKLPLYTYAVVEGVRDGCVQLTSSDFEGIVSVEIGSFLSEVSDILIGDFAVK